MTRIDGSPSRPTLDPCANFKTLSVLFDSIWYGLHSRYDRKQLAAGTEKYFSSFVSSSLSASNRRRFLNFSVIQLPSEALHRQLSIHC